MDKPIRVSPAAEQVAVILTRKDFKQFLTDLDTNRHQFWPEVELLTREPYKTWYEEWRESK